MAPRAKRIRLAGEKKLEELPREVLYKIVGYVPLEQQIPISSMSIRLRSATPFTVPNGRLNVMNLPYAADLIVHVENSRDWPSRYDFVTAAGITSGLEFLLPKMGADLQSVSFESSTRYWEMASSHMDLLAQHCPNLTELKLLRMCYAGRNDFNAGALRRLTQLSSFALGYFSDKMRRRGETVLMREIADLIANWPLTQLSLTGFYRYSCPSISAPNLIRLSLVKCRLDNTQLAEICQTSTLLTELTIDDCANLTDFYAIGQLQSLTELKLLAVPVDDNQMDWIAQNCPQLIRLSLGRPHCWNLSWLRHLGHLRFFAINIDWNRGEVYYLPNDWLVEDLVMTESGLTDAGLATLSLKCPLLKRLTLTSSYSITDEGINQISATWGELEYLKISNYKITGDSVARLGQRQNLRHLDIENCGGSDNSYGFWLLVIDRQRLGISTPLRIRVGSRYYDRYEVFEAGMSALLIEKLKNVGVELIQPNITTD